MSTRSGRAYKMSDDNNKKSTNATSSNSNSIPVFDESSDLENLNVAQLLKALILDSRNVNSRNQGQNGTRLDSGLPRYRGKRGEDINKWLTLANNSLEVARIKEEHKCRAISLYLEGPALGAYLKQHLDTREKNEQLNFVGSTGNSDDIYRARTSLQYLKQKGDFDHYLEEFRRLCTKGKLEDEFGIQYLKLDQVAEL